MRTLAQNYLIHTKITGWEVKDNHCSSLSQDFIFRVIPGWDYAVPDSMLGNIFPALARKKC
jgi:hypothetical protein